jgi:hypothetical protein
VFALALVSMFGFAVLGVRERKIHVNGKRLTNVIAS